MPTKTKARQLGLFEGHPWPNNNTSDFEYNSPPSSPTLSSGYESIISEDLDLYDPSLGVGFKLTDEQISTLDERTDEFLTAGYTGWEQIVQNAFNSFANAWPKCLTFNKDLVRALIRQWLYCKIKLLMDEPTPRTQTPMEEESVSSEKTAMTGKDTDNPTPRTQSPMAEEGASGKETALADKDTNNPTSRTQSLVAEEIQEITLTDKHVRKLESQAAKFQAANPNDREKMITDAANRIERTWQEGVEFDRDTVTNLIRQHLFRKVKRGSKKTAFDI